MRILLILLLMMPWMTGADELLEQADARIQQHRQGEIALRLVDRDGEAIPAASLEIRQTRHAFLFGCNIFGWGRQETPELEKAYREQYAALFNFATLPYYWWSYERQAGKPAHASREEVARWCQQHRMATKGHPLAWNFIDPGWLPDNPARIKTLQLDRVGDCVQHFRGLVDRWDVVNEVTHFDRKSCWDRAPKLTALYQQEGAIAFTRDCFARARSAHPEAELLINDYRTDPAYERVVEQLVDASGKRVYDVIGIQSHMHGGTWASSKVWDVCERFSRFDVPLHFTELTILSGEEQWEKKPPWPSTPEREARQAREVERIYTLLFSHPSVEAITWWDFADRGAWKNAPAGFLRRDLSPKPAYQTLHDLIHKRWKTETTLTTGPEGQASFRGFFGDYVVLYTLGEQTHSAVFTLDPDRKDPWIFNLGDH